MFEVDSEDWEVSSCQVVQIVVIIPRTCLQAAMANIAGQPG